MNKILSLQEERNKLFDDLDAGIIPKRVPVATSMDIAYVMQYKGCNMREAQFDIKKLMEMLEIAASDFHSDANPAGVSRPANLYHILGAKNFVMSSSGFIQHPEVIGLMPSEYDELIRDPYKCIHDIILPRLYKNLDADPQIRMITMAKAYKVFFDTMGQLALHMAHLDAKYGLAHGLIQGIQTEPPFDLIADQFRSFSGISIDIRRQPEKVIAACEAVLPMTIKAGISPRSSRRIKTFIPLHMAPYLKEKDFAKFYWPTFKQLVEGLVQAGAGVYLFVEQDWMRFLDYLYELPKGTFMVFEYGDPKTIKEKLGKKHILGGLYPVSMLAHGSKQECINKAKELIDIMAPGGNYVFTTDKVIINYSDAKPENIVAVNEFVREYAVY